MGNATPYANKKWVASNNHETHTLHVCNNEQMRLLIHKKYCTVNTIYIGLNIAVISETGLNVNLVPQGLG